MSYKEALEKIASYLLFESDLEDSVSKEIDVLREELKELEVYKRALTLACNDLAKVKPIQTLMPIEGLYLVQAREELESD